MDKDLCEYCVTKKHSELILSPMSYKVHNVCFDCFKSLVNNGWPPVFSRSYHKVQTNSPVGNTTQGNSAGYTVGNGTTTAPNDGRIWEGLIIGGGEGGSGSKDTKPEPKCECGKEKHGFASHSDWCEIKE